MVVKNSTVRQGSDLLVHHYNPFEELVWQTLTTILFSSNAIHASLNYEDQMPKPTRFQTAKIRSSKPAPPPAPLSAVQLAKIIGILILLTVPLDVVVLNLQFELANRQRISLQVVGAALCLILGLMCYVRRIVGWVQTIVLHSFVYTESRLFGTTLVAILALVPLLIFFRQWRLSPDRKTAFIALVALAVGAIQVFQFIHGIISSLKSQDPATIHRRIAQGRLLATVVGFASARILTILLAISLPRTASMIFYYYGSCLCLLYIGLVLLHELELPIEIVPLTSMEVRTILKRSEIIRPVTKRTKHKESKTRGSISEAFIKEMKSRLKRHS